MIYRDNNLVQIGYDNEADATFLIYKRNVSSDEFISTHQEVIDMYDTLDRGPGKHYVDTSKLGVIPIEGQQWVAKNVVPKIREKGNVDKALIAIILSDDVFAKFAVQNIKSKTTDYSVISFFENMDQAKQWLSQPALAKSA